MLSPLLQQPLPLCSDLFIAGGTRLDTYESVGRVYSDFLFCKKKIYNWIYCTFIFISIIFFCFFGFPFNDHELLRVLFVCLVASLLLKIFFCTNANCGSFCRNFSDPTKSSTTLPNCTHFSCISINLTQSRLSSYYSIHATAVWPNGGVFEILLGVNTNVATFCKIVGNTTKR